jgi:hypothetical protein
MQHFNVIWHKFKDEVDKEYFHSTTQKFKIADIWNDYLTVQNYFYDLETPTKKSAYLDAVKKRVESKHRKLLQILALLKMTKEGLGYTNLRKHYNFKSKLLMPFFVPFHLVKLLYSYGTNQKKRKKLFEIASSFVN